MVSNDPATIPRVTASETREAARRGAVIVDVRGVEAFRQGHIPGAILADPNTAEMALAHVPPDTPIITYCT
jgi:rhodanese-related sulfurtransferase